MSGTNSTSGRRRSSAEAARKAMAEARTTQRRNNLLFAGGTMFLATVLVVIIAIAVTRSANSQQAATAATDINKPPATTAVGRDTPPPWAAPADATAAVASAGLPMLTQEGSAEHIHAHLDVRVNGQAVPVAALIGIDQARGSISPLHTHDASGVLHIESPVNRPFSLGEFFSEWGVSLAEDHIGSLRATADHPLRVYVDGAPRTGNPAAITFAAHDEIALVYGQQPESVPAHYDFPSGE